MTILSNTRIEGLNFTSCDVLLAKDNLLCHTTAHADIHLGQKLRASLTPAVVLWEHGNLTEGRGSVRVGSRFLSKSVFVLPLHVPDWGLGA